MNAAFIKVGLTGCDVGVSYLLPRLVGGSLAAELMMTGRFIDAGRALGVGLLSRVVSPDALLEAGETLVAELLAELLAAAPLGLRLTKEGIEISEAPSPVKATPLRSGE